MFTIYSKSKSLYLCPLSVLVNLNIVSLFQNSDTMTSLSYDIFTSLFDSASQISNDLTLAMIFIVIAVVIEILLALLLTKRIHEYLHLRVVYKRNLRCSKLNDQRAMKRRADNSTVVDMEPSCRPRCNYVAATIADLPV